MARLNEEHKTFIVTSLACFRTYKQVIDDLQANFNITVTLQQIQFYDPTNTWKGKRLGKKWQAVHAEARRLYVSDTARCGLSHQAYRFRILQDALDREIDKGFVNRGAIMALVEQGAKESGGAYTNARVHTGPGGGPITVSVEDQKKAAAARMLAKLKDKMPEADARAKLIEMGVDERDLPAVPGS